MRKNERKRQKKKALKNRLAKRRGGPAPHKNVPKLYEKRRGEPRKRSFFFYCRPQNRPFGQYGRA